MRKTTTIILILTIFGLSGFSQTLSYWRYKIINQDTFATLCFREVRVVGQMGRKGRKMYKRNAKLIRNVKKVMPYAKVVAQRLIIVDKKVADIPTEAMKKRYYKMCEKKLVDDFDGEIRHLSYSQGKLLIKLIDRETGKSTFNNIKHYKSGVSAVFWQSFARLFGTTLKMNYNDEEEVMIEYIISMLGYN